MAGKLSRLWHRLMRAGGLESRTLQVREILDGAQEHLQAAALPGLEKRFLPARLEVEVSAADYRNLEPFTSYLEQGLQEVFENLGRRSPWILLVPRLEVRLASADGLPVGSAPRFQATFPDGESQAAWKPASAVDPSVTTSVETLLVPRPDSVYELILTSQSASRTALQTVLWLWLGPSLSTGWWLPSGDDLKLEPTGDGGLRTGGGELPPELEHRSAAPRGWPEMLSPAPENPWLHRFVRIGKPDLLWVPGGSLILGRRASQVHWVPTSAPRNLSGLHLALVRTPEAPLAVVDLGSTNGTLLDSRRLRPWQPVAVEPPSAIDIGQEGTLRLDIRLRRLDPESNPWG